MRRRETRPVHHRDLRSNWRAARDAGHSFHVLINPRPLTCDYIDSAEEMVASLMRDGRQLAEIQSVGTARPRPGTGAPPYLDSRTGTVYGTVDRLATLGI